MILLDTIDLMLNVHGFKLWQIIILALIGILLIVGYLSIKASKTFFYMEQAKSFRLEITGFENNAVRIGVYTAEELSGQGVSDILTTALPVIGKKDPHLLRLLLYHCLEALEADEQIRGALVRFHEEVGQALSDG